MRRYISFFLALAMLLPLASCGGGSSTAAATMHLRRAEGTVGVADGEGKDLEPKENLGLYSGYGVDTQAASYAWIDLDSVKLTKMDQDSEIAITKEGKNLEIEVKSGSLFFNVTQPLEVDETITIRTSSMMVGIRGTCGWVALSEDKSTLSVCLLEGKVECSNEDSTAAVSAGEKGTIPASGEITVEPFDQNDLPAFVRTELDENGAPIKENGDSSGAGTPLPSETDPIRLRDMYTYSRTLRYDANGELLDGSDFLPDEQGRIGKLLTQSYSSTIQSDTECVYGDTGTLYMYVYSSGITSIVTEDTADHRTVVCEDYGWEVITDYDDQGRATRSDDYISGDLADYTTFTYDTEGKLVRSDNYFTDGSLRAYTLYEYD